jgi:ribonuclease P/MRP protein subunit RPP1
MKVQFDREAVLREYGIDVVDGIEIGGVGKRTARDVLDAVRPDTTIVVFRADSPELNRFGAERDRVDVLADPMAGDANLNHVIVKAAVEHEVFLEVSLGRVLRTSGGPRVRALRGLRKLRELIEAHEAPFVVSAGARTHLQLREPRALLSLGEEIGFDRQQIETGLQAWKELADRNRERQSAAYLGPGVRLGTDDSVE